MSRRGRTYSNGLVRWSETYAAAWFGFLETHKRLTAQLETELKAQHGLSLSGFELLSRLARAQERTLRLTTLAEAAGLSLSRVSRVLDQLETRGLVERRADASDTRAKNAWLTPAGLEVLQAALARRGYVAPDPQGLPDLTSDGRDALVALIKAGCSLAQLRAARSDVTWWRSARTWPSGARWMIR